MIQKNKKRRAKDEDARGKSWVPGQKGQGGEGLSNGYGASAGEGTGAAGPEGGKRSKPKKKAAREEKRDADYSPSLPSREKIAKVLR